MAATPGAPGAEAQPAFAPLDPQKVQDQQDMTWADYHPIPGIDWADPSRQPELGFNMALVAVDFPDQPFVMTLPKKSDPFGNPQIDPVPREQVARFYADFFMKPSAVNHGHTINGYWMEQSRGKFGITSLDCLGVYRMPTNYWVYGLAEYGQSRATPDGSTARGNMERDCDALWTAATGKSRRDYNCILRIYAGYDETGVWQEFGEMKFQTTNDIPPEWGNPNPEKPRWAPTRYVPWTSWLAGSQHWGQATIRQGENSGTITHELGHFAFGIPDNNNNPYEEPYHRVGAGPWDMMDRGSFNGPGGPHSRWVVPATQGAAMPAGLMLRNRLLNGFITRSQCVMLNRNGLAKSGLAVATVTARAVEPLPGTVAGLTVTLDGDDPKDHTSWEDSDKNPLCAGDPVYNFYALEVIQRIGYDSFCPDSGVLLAKNKDGSGSSFSNKNGLSRTSYGIFSWVIDAHPEDIHQVDFKRPHGEPVMRTVADYRQLNDALFHAGLNSGSQYEWEDTPNRLHFYVIDLQKDSRGVLSYTVGVRSLDGAGPQQRGVKLDAPPAASALAPNTPCVFTLKNTGSAAASDPSLHAEEATAYLNSDIYRLSVSVAGQGWTAQLNNALATAHFGESISVPVFLSRAAGSAAGATVTLKATSESDPAKMDTATVKMSP